MARRKRTSIVLEKSGRRLAGMESIDPQLDLGNGLSLSAFSRVIETLRAKENAYNTALSSLDKLYQDMMETERQLSDLAEHMLLGVAARYGRSSVEYGRREVCRKVNAVKVCAVNPSQEPGQRVPALMVHRRSQLLSFVS